MSAQLVTLRILWGALLMSTVLFLVAGYLVISGREDTPVPEFVLLPALAVESVVLIVVSVVLPARQLREALTKLQLVTEELPAHQRLFSDQQQRGRVFANSQQARARMASVIVAPVILGLALSEAVALNGLVLWILGFPLHIAIGFFVVSWVLILSRFPHPKTYEREVERVYDADLR